MEYGLIGEHLPHSFSKQIHEQLTGEAYALCELRPQELEGFLQTAAFRAVNVTIPYKQAVMPYLAEIDGAAERIGAVNCIVNRDGRLCGYNTDYLGLRALVLRMGLDLKNKKVLVLGSGGTSRTACAVAESLGAKSIYRVSRSGRDGCLTYEQAVAEHSDAHILFSTTPSGMFPHTEEQPVDLALFPALEGVVDVVYNPLRTRLVQQAQELGIPAEGGLYMLVSQAVAAAEIFRDTQYPAESCEHIYRSILAQRENIVLTGMPGSGKSTVGKLLAQKLQRSFIDLDSRITEMAGCEISDIFAKQGEAAFRDLESQSAAEAARETGCVIATGGGAVLRPENVRRLKQNGRIFFLNRPLEDICPTEDRPLSRDRESLQRRFLERYPIYQSTAQAEIPVTGTPEEVCRRIMEEYSL